MEIFNIICSIIIGIIALMCLIILFLNVSFYLYKRSIGTVRFIKIIRKYHEEQEIKNEKLIENDLFEEVK